MNPRGRPSFCCRLVSLLLSAIAATVSPARASGETSNDIETLKGLSLEQLVDVEVTSVSRYAQKILDAPASIEVVDHDALMESTAFTLAEAMRLAGNLNVAQKDPHDWAISARGFNSNVGDKMLVLIDGRSVYTPLFAGVFWNAQDYVLEDVDRIEAISGPGGTLWGENAVNGVINVTTKSAKDTQGLFAEAAAGTPWGAVTSARYGGALAPNVYYRVYGKFLTETNALLTSGVHAHDAWEQRQGGFRVDALPSSETTLTLQGDVYSGDLEIQSGNSARLAGGNLLGRVSRTLGDDSSVQLQLYFDRTHVADPFAATPFAPAGFAIDDLDTWDIDFQHSLQLSDRNHLVWGFDFRWTIDRLKQAAPNLAFRPADENNHLASGFVQDEIQVNDHFAFIIGTKVGHNSLTGWEVQPNIRLRNSLSPTQRVWAGISRAVRMPARYDRDLAIPNLEQPLIQGGPEIRSETVIAYELGYRAQLRSNFSLSASTFYNSYDRLRGLTVTPVTSFPLVYDNNLEGHTYGAELSAEWQVTPSWRLNGAYDLLREHIEVKPGRTDFFNALDETEDPEHQVLVRSSLDFARHFRWYADFRWIDDLIANASGRPTIVPSYYEADTQLAWRVRDSLEFAVGGKNLLHDHHPEFGPPVATQEQLRRFIYLRVSCRF